MRTTTTRTCASTVGAVLTLFIPPEREMDRYVRRQEEFYEDDRDNDGE
jgi:hypothetical protein